MEDAPTPVRGHRAPLKEGAFGEAGVTSGEPVPAALNAELDEQEAEKQR
ncbi:hypothetical protein [Streptomyces sp. NPDC058457]